MRHRTDKVAGYTYDSGIMLSADSPKLEAEGHFETFEVLLDCLKRMESILLGMKQMRGYVGERLGKQMLESLIEEAEAQIAEVKRKVIQ